MNKTNFLSAIFLILLGIVGRFFLIHYVSIPNFEIITALTLVSAVFLGRIWALVVPLSIIAITDAVIGNNSVMFFTWSAFAIIGVLGGTQKSLLASLCKGREQNPSLAPPKRGINFPLFKGGLRGILGMTGLGIISSVFFFLYTNFGWWLVSNMYPHTLDGLIQCYIMGLPFFKNNLIGNLIFVPTVSVAAIFFIRLKAKIKNKSIDFKKVLSS